MSLYADQLREALEQYRAEAEALERNRKPLDGIFGTGSSIKSNACHDRFDTSVEKILRQAAADGAPEEECFEAVAFVLDAAMPAESTQSVGLFLIAAQRHCLPLIDCLPQAGAAKLAERYEKRWPKRTRLPVQAELVKRLKARAKK